MSISFRQMLVTVIVGSTLDSCKQDEVDGILIDHTLYENQSLKEDRELRQLIRQTLNKDEKALAKLNNFRCGGGAGCYDLGFIMTQIIYRIGENAFTEMVAKLDNNEMNGLEGLIKAGLEYGDHDKDGKMDNKRIDREFPKLSKQMEMRK